jgi:pimeloyl-ACP methyl ester carboxylesterase
MDMASQSPDSVEKLILCDTALAFPPTELWQQRADTVRTGVMEAIVESVLARWVVDSARPDSSGLRLMLLRTPTEGYAGAAEALRDVTADSVLGRIVHPTTILVGERDNLTPFASAYSLHAAIPGSYLTVIPGGAHIPTFECSNAVTEAIGSALASHAPPAVRRAAVEQREDIGDPR